MNIVAAITLEALGADVTANLARYCSALEIACDASPPPFGTRRYGDIYRTVAADPYWLSASLVTNAEREAEGATRLGSLAACTQDAEVSALVKQHAIDESRHARWYLALLGIAFPEAVDETLRPHLEMISPRYCASMVPEPIDGSAFAHAVTLDDLVQMNIAEIRTTINQRLQRPMLIAHCPSERRDKLVTLLNALLQDEIRHVAYSARLIERFAKQDDGGGCLVDLMSLRVFDFNEITNEEVEQKVFPLHGSREMCRREADKPGSCIQDSTSN
jgi:tRNA isopentenyl-2-thiomethyl-A-37 hydroxylase MiaE